MFLLNWDGFSGTASAGPKPWALRVKPNLSFEFDKLAYVLGAGQKTLAEQSSDLTPAELAAIEAWLLGADPTASSVELVHAADAAGVYVGLQPIEQAVTVLTGPPPSASWRWSVVDHAWQRTTTLAEAKAEALQEMDRQAQALYNQAIANPAIKDEYNAAYQSALAWLANPIGPVPLRVAALASKFGISNVLAATVVKNKTEEGNAKLDQRGAARLQGKAAIETASTLAAVQAALQAGVAAMTAINFTVS